MIIDPRPGPFSAISALASTSWYQRGKSSACGVNTFLLTDDMMPHDAHGPSVRTNVARRADRRGDAVAQAARPGWVRPACGRRDLRLAPAGLARAEAGRADRPRGD